MELSRRQLLSTAAGAGLAALYGPELARAAAPMMGT